MRHIIPAKFLILCLLLFCQKVNGQSAQVDSLKNRFERFQRTNLQEKIYVHLDHTSYITGETMWFKVYCVDATVHSFLDISKVAYVEIIDRDGQSVLKAKVELSKGEGAGYLFLPAILESGNYVLRAYTNWMKNSPPEYFFRQAFTIVNPFRKKDKSPAATKPAIDAQFFPEGGTLLEGITSKIAFRIVNEQGSGMTCTGSIINELNDTVARFSPVKFGLGVFDFKPGNNTYRAVIVDENKKKYTAPFPKASTRGYSLELLDEQQNIRINVRTLGIEPSSVILLGHTRGKNFFIKELPVINGSSSFTVSASLLGEGVSHFTLLNEKLQPVCERLRYTKPKARLDVRAGTDQNEYSLRRKVKLTIDVLDENSKPVDGSFSVSVHKRDSIDSIDRKDILSHLLLGSDLNGEIESLPYYVKNGAPGEFDVLMLTHGWRRFAWEEVTASAKRVPNHLPELEGPLLTGKLDNEDGTPAHNIPTFLTNASNAIRVHSSLSGKGGELRYALDNIKGTTRLYLQTDFNRDSAFRFTMNDPFFNGKIDNTAIPPLTITHRQTETIISRSVAMQVQDIYAEEQKKNQRSTQDTIPFYGAADEIYYLDDYTRFPVMEEVMREYVKGVWVRKRQGKFYFIVLDNVNKSIFKQQPLILLDGVPIFDVNQIMAIDPRKVKRIDVLTGEYYLGTNTFPGIVSYFTYSGDMAGVKPHPKTTVLEYEGLQVKREFFSPIYETERQRSARLPDQRQLLTWIPFSKLTEGKAEFEFFTSDVPGTFEINIQGAANGGRFGSTSKSFTVSDYNN